MIGPNDDTLPELHDDAPFELGPLVQRFVDGLPPHAPIAGGAPIDAHDTDRDAWHDVFAHSQFAEWLTHDTRARQSRTERMRSARLAAGFARRMRAAIGMARTTPKIPIAPLRVRDADVVGTIGQIAADARRARCAPWLENVSVAAGLGREIWDEPCERWVELPPSASLAPHVALNVAGDSMSPFLESGDTLLVRVGVPPVVGDLVVALHPGHGYVVKRLSAMTATEFELESFNPRYPPLRILRHPGVVVGTVAGVLKDGV